MNTTFQAPPLTSVNKWLLIIASVLFLLESFLRFQDISLAPYLGLSWSGFSSGHLYQLATYPFLSLHLMGVLFNGLCLWFLGSELELTWGRKFYITYLIICSCAAGLFYLFVTGLFYSGSLLQSMPLLGLTGITFSLLAAYGLIFSERYLSFMFLFPIKAKYFCLLLGAIEAYQAFFSVHGKSSWGHLFAMSTGLIVLHIRNRSMRGLPLWSFASASDIRKRMLQSKLKKSHLKIVKDSEDDQNSSDKMWH